MKAVFADTFYWIALTNPADRHAQEVLRFDDLLSEAVLYTSEEVLIDKRRLAPSNPRQVSGQ